MPAENHQGLCGPQAKDIADHLKKKSVTANGEPGAQRFVWGKKIEKDIQSGASIKDFTKKAEQERQRQREVRVTQPTRGASTHDSRLTSAVTCFGQGVMFRRCSIPMTRA
jgi:hypothetical protein